MNRESSKTSDAGTLALSIILHVRQATTGLSEWLARIRQQRPDAEVLVVDGEASDATRLIALTQGARVIASPASLGHGAAIKAGARAASGAVLVFLDGDGQDDPADIPRLLAALEVGHDLAVGARGQGSQAGLAHAAYHRFASLMTGYPVRDLASGFLAVNAVPFRRFLSLLQTGDSATATIAMAFFRSGYPVAYVPIQAGPQTAGSRPRPVRDAVRFLPILLQIVTLSWPLKLFLPISAAVFCAGLGSFLSGDLTQHAFAPISALLFTIALIMLMTGVVLEQLTTLSYRDCEH